MSTELDRRRVAELMDSIEQELAGIPDSAAKRDTLDRIEDRYIQIMATVRDYTAKLGDQLRAEAAPTAPRPPLSPEQAAARAEQLWREIDSLFLDAMRDAGALRS